MKEEFKLTKDEAKFIWEMLNYNQNLAMRNLNSQLHIFEEIDKRDNGKRLDKWFDESSIEFDKCQTIKAKMSVIIDEVDDDEN